MKILLYIILVLSLQISACSSTRYTITKHAPSGKLCQQPGETLSALIIWWPDWRPDQKDVPDREGAAKQGIEKFFAHSGCYAHHYLQRVTDGRNTIDNDKALKIAGLYQSKPNRLVLITVRELGPFLKLRLAPVFLVGGTEVVFDVSVMNVENGLLISHFRTRWQNGGAFVIKGVASLEQDIQSALGSVIH